MEAEGKPTKSRQLNWIQKLKDIIEFDRNSFLYNRRTIVRWVMPGLFLIHVLSFLFNPHYPTSLFTLALTFYIPVFIFLYLERMDLFNAILITYSIFSRIAAVLLSDKNITFALNSGKSFPILVMLLTQRADMFIFCLLGGVIVDETFLKHRIEEYLLQLDQENVIKFISSNLKFNAFFSFTSGIGILFFVILLKKTVTELNKAKSRLEEANEKQHNFILSLSHELRNPMNSLLGNLTLAMAEDNFNTIRDLIENACVCGEVLLQFFNNILDSGKHEIGKLEITPKDTKIRDLLENIWVVCSQIIQNKKLYGYLSLKNKVPNRLILDGHRLNQVMMNLISNSTKFTEKGGIRVTVEWLDKTKISDSCFEPIPYDEEGVFERDIMRNGFNYSFNKSFQDERLTLTCKKFESNKNSDTQEPSKGILKIIVNDTGCGMNEENLKTLFTKFTQVHNDSSKTRIGTGLGLWITKEIVEKMGGEIRVYSKINHGTTFIMCIPSESKKMNFPRRQKIKNVLLFDDDTNSVKMMNSFLKSAGINLLGVANNVNEAARIFKNLILQKTHVDMIITNVDLPVEGGEEAIKAIRKIEQAQNIPSCKVIFLGTNLTNQEIKEITSPTGTIRANSYLVKPIKLIELEECLLQISED